VEYEHWETDGYGFVFQHSFESLNVKQKHGICGNDIFATGL